MPQLTVPPASGLREALSRFRAAFLWLAFFSGIVNLLILTGAIFMLEVYYRVLPSGTVPTLVALAVLASVLFGTQALLDIIRSRILVRVGKSLGRSLGARLFDAAAHPALVARNGADARLSLRDLEHMRAFISGVGLLALFDLPWVPVYLLICFALHFWIGITALIGTIVLFALALVNE